MGKEGVKSPGKKGGCVHEASGKKKQCEQQEESGEAEEDKRNLSKPGRKSLRNSALTRDEGR